MTMQPLGVDPPLLMGHGSAMETSADQIPDPPEPFAPHLGCDELSAAIGREIPKAEAPILEGLPPLKQSAKETASNIQTAAQRYSATDRRLAEEYERHRFDMVPEAGGSGGGDRTGAVGGAGTSPAGTGAGSGSDILGQMMGMPMQMAGQAAQAPSQAMGSVASAPQGAIHGVQGAMQQVGQLTGPSDKGVAGGDGPTAAVGETGDKPQDAVPAELVERAKDGKDGSLGAGPEESRTDGREGYALAPTAAQWYEMRDLSAAKAIEKLVPPTG